MPVYNGADYVESAIQSVLAQTYRDFEIVLVNDGSRDEGRTHAIGERYAAENPEIVRYIHQENGGVGSALNQGIAAMRGDIFCWLSHDDLYEPQKLERQVAFFDRLKKPDAILMSNYVLIDLDGEQYARVWLDHATALRAPRFPLYRGWVNGCTIFVPKELFLSQAPFDPKYRHVQDYRLWLELLKKHEIFHQPESLVRYRVHSHQDSRQPAAVVEADALWSDMLDGLEVAARAQLCGSSRRFFDEERQHLEISNYPGAAKHAAALVEATNSTLVSIVIPTANAGPLVQASLTSALNQTCEAVEILLAPSDPAVATDLAKLAADPRVRIAAPVAGGPAAVLNHALRLSRGDYVALLEPGDLFALDKVARQHDAMQTQGALWSSTRSRPGKGRVPKTAPDPHEAYEAILHGAIPAASTVMLHRLLVSEGHALPEGDDPLRDPLFWLDIAARRAGLRLNAALTTSDRTGALPGGDFDPAVMRAVSDHPVHGPKARSLAASPRRRAPGPPSLIERGESAMRLEEFRTELDERLRFVSDPDYYLSLSLPVDLRGPSHGYTHATPEQPAEGVRFTTGEQPWAYVAAVPFERGETANLLDVQFATEDDEAFVRLVDSKYEQVIERQRIPPCIQGRVWFEIGDLPRDLILIVQVGAKPADQPITIVSAAQHAPDPRLGPTTAPVRSPDRAAA